jgi:uncharacterized membrane protein YeaQ/YmgE (transglycosylase-associated protein family)
MGVISAVVLGPIAGPVDRITGSSHGPVVTTAISATGTALGGWIADKVFHTDKPRASSTSPPGSPTRPVPPPSRPPTAGALGSSRRRPAGLNPCARQQAPVIDVPGPTGPAFGFEPADVRWQRHGQ